MTPAVPNNPNRQIWYLRQAVSMRVSAGLTQGELASRARVGRGTVGRIEKRKAVTKVKATRVFVALRDILSRPELREEDYVTPVRPEEKDM